MRRREKERRVKGHVSALERALPPPQLLPRSQRNWNWNQEILGTIRTTSLAMKRRRRMTLFLPRSHVTQNLSHMTRKMKKVWKQIHLGPELLLWLMHGMYLNYCMMSNTGNLIIIVLVCFTYFRLTEFRSAVVKAFSTEHSQSLPIDQLTELVNSGTASRFNSAEVSTALEQMQDANQVMVSEGVVFLIWNWMLTCLTINYKTIVVLIISCICMPLDY